MHSFSLSRAVIKWILIKMNILECETGFREGETNFFRGIAPDYKLCLFNLRQWLGIRYRIFSLWARDTVPYL